jgi:hypothetical protein
MRLKGKMHQIPHWELEMRPLCTVTKSVTMIGDCRTFGSVLMKLNQFQLHFFRTLGDQEEF